MAGANRLAHRDRSYRALATSAKVVASARVLHHAPRCTARWARTWHVRRAPRLSAALTAPTSAASRANVGAAQCCLHDQHFHWRRTAKGRRGPTFHEGAGSTRAALRLPPHSLRGGIRSVRHRSCLITAAHRHRLEEVDSGQQGRCDGHAAHALWLRRHRCAEGTAYRHALRDRHGGPCLGRSST